MSVLFRVGVRIGVFIGVPSGVGFGMLIGLSVFGRRLVGRVVVVLQWCGKATSRRRGQHGSEEHEHGEAGRQDSLQTISDQGQQGNEASAPTG